jgi:hypothetical protein
MSIYRDHDVELTSESARPKRASCSSISGYAYLRISIARSEKIFARLTQEVTKPAR